MLSTACEQLHPSQKRRTASAAGGVASIWGGFSFTVMTLICASNDNKADRYAPRGQPPEKKKEMF
jgi:hypothetical protein